MATIIATPVIYVIFAAFDVTPANALQELGLALASFITAALLVSGVTNLLVGDMVRSVHSIAAAAGRSAPTLFAFIERHLGRIDEQVQAVLSEQGALLDIEEIQFWTEMSFYFGKGTTYDGTDSHVPSAFVRLYPTYLQAHSEMLATTASPADRGSRVLIGKHSDFRDDFILRYDQGYKGFLKWHDDERVPLLHAEESTARRVADSIDLGSYPPPGRLARFFRRVTGRPAVPQEPPPRLPTLDMGVWHGRYALLFREEVPESDSHELPARPRVRLWLMFPEHPWYQQCVSVLSKLKGTAQTAGEATRLADAVPEIFERQLVRNWENFVRPAARNKTLGPFLRHLLEPYRDKSVLDAAAGIGTDALWLEDNGWTDVTLNEIEPFYREVIREKYDGREPRLFEQDWRTLPTIFGQWFNAILVLGNSLCLLSKRAEQLRALRGLAAVLKPGGIFLIDERNFAPLFGNGNTKGANRRPLQPVLDNPVKFFPYKGNVIYCGEGVHGYPKVITPKDVLFAYYRTDSRFEDRLRADDQDVLSDDLRRELESREIGTLHLYPFDRGELGGLLHEAGFKDIQVYADLDFENPRPWTPDPSDWFSADADFFTYCAVKQAEQPAPKAQKKTGAQAAPPAVSAERDARTPSQREIPTPERF